MKKIFTLTTLCALMVVSCAKEQLVGEVSTTPRTLTINASIPDTKTALGEKSGDCYPNFWKAGDKISVNGVASDPLDSLYDGKKNAKFTITGIIESPYYVAYPSSAVSAYTDGSATVTIASSQSFTSNSYDPKAFIMLAKTSEIENLTIDVAVSVLRLKLTGDGTIKKVTFSSESDALSGKFTTDFETLTPSTTSKTVSLSGEVELPADFLVCVPAGVSQPITIKAESTDGGSMQKTANLKKALEAGTIYTFPELEYAPEYKATISNITSSTADVAWGSSYEDEYSVRVCTDQALTDIVKEYNIPAASVCWASKSPKLCVSGLAQNTKYYVSVENVTNEMFFETAEFTTEPFTVVEVGTTDAAVGDVLLAEDFSEIQWDRDYVGGAAGWVPEGWAPGTAQTKLFNYDSTKTFVKDGYTETQINKISAAVSSSRLKNWAEGANNTVYPHPGYFKLVGSDAITHLVTPALTNIPDDKVATIEVTVTASRYSGASQNAIVAVINQTLKSLTASNPKNTLDFKVFKKITLNSEIGWDTYTVTFSNVASGSRIAFGPDPSLTKNTGRMNISDITVKLTALDDKPALTASCIARSSSSLAFKWATSADYTKAYTIWLYSDEECTELVTTYDISASHACWKSKQPIFSIGGLEQNKAYFFKVKNTTDNIESAVIMAATTPFTVVTMPASITKKTVVLAEDFSELLWGCDYINRTAGITPSDESDYSSRSASAYIGYDDKPRYLTTDTTALKNSRIKDWMGLNCHIYTGYFKLGGSSATTWLVTPKFTVPKGKIAVVDVKITASRYSNSSNSTYCIAAMPVSSDSGNFSKASLSQAELNNITSTDKYKEVTISNYDSWSSVTCSGLYVSADDRIVFGLTKAGKYSSNVCRAFISDMTVTVTNIIDKK